MASSADLASFAPCIICFASVGVLLYCIGAPILCVILTRRWRHLPEHRPRIDLLLKTYDDGFYYGEAISLLHKFFFTGCIHIIAPESRLQIWAGALASVFCFIAFLLTKPLRYEICDHVQTVRIQL